jgi:hypothetical protein
MLNEFMRQQAITKGAEQRVQKEEYEWGRYDTANKICVRVTIHASAAGRYKRRMLKKRSASLKS